MPAMVTSASGPATSRGVPSSFRAAGDPATASVTTFCASGDKIVSAAIHTIIADSNTSFAPNTRAHTQTRARMGDGECQHTRVPHISHAQWGMWQHHCQHHDQQQKYDNTATLHSTLRLTWIHSADGADDASSLAPWIARTQSPNHALTVSVNAASVAASEPAGAGGGGDVDAVATAMIRTQRLSTSLSTDACPHPIPQPAQRHGGCNYQL